MLLRRELLTGLAAALILPRRASAEIACQPWGEGQEVCQAGLKFAPEMTTAEQQCPYWCWAACIESIFAIDGFRVPQQQIVARVYGGVVCAAADGPTIARAVSGQWQDDAGRAFNASCDVVIDQQYGVWRNDAPLLAAKELEAGRPLILGALGHAVLLTAMTFGRDAYGNTQVGEMVIRDPWPTNPNRRTLSMQEAQQISFLATVQVG
jgi:hypothetical protein